MIKNTFERLLEYFRQKPELTPDEQNLVKQIEEQLE